MSDNTQIIDRIIKCYTCKKIIKYKYKLYAYENFLQNKINTMHPNHSMYQITLKLYNALTINIQLSYTKIKTILLNYSELSELIKYENKYESIINLHKILFSKDYKSVILYDKIIDIFIDILLDIDKNMFTDIKIEHRPDFIVTKLINYLNVITRKEKFYLNIEDIDVFLFYVKQLHNIYPELYKQFYEKIIKLNNIENEISNISYKKPPKINLK